MSRYRYFIKLAYRGTCYHGWQVQDNANSVQQELNNALSTFIGASIHCNGCGRTDTGVHASEFYAHFDLDNLIENPKEMAYKLNGCLPLDIAILDIFQVADAVHARFDASSRTYTYRISREKNPFNQDSAYYLYGELNEKAMQNAADILKEYTDFSCFSKSGTQNKTNDCTIMSAKWKQDGKELVFTITANRFLRNMVRAIVGTLIEVGKGRFNELEFRKIIEGKNRSEAGYSVPAQGLYLTKVEYPESIRFNKK